MRRVRYGRRPCRGCGELITTNALGRAAHEKACKGAHQEPKPSPRCPYCGFGVANLAMHINAKHPEKAQ